MNAIEIEDLFKAIIEKNWKKVLQYANVQVEGNIEDFVKNTTKKEEILKKIMLNIEHGDYEYFSSIINNPIYKMCYIELMSFSTKADDIKQLIEKRKELSLSSKFVVKLIKATNEVAYIKRCIEKRRELAMNAINVTDLIIATNDIEYIKSCIEKSVEIGLNKEDVIVLIKETDTEYIKLCVENRDELILFSNDVVELIQATNDAEYVKQCIERKDELEFCLRDIFLLLIETKDREYIENYIEKLKPKDNEKQSRKGKSIKLPDDMTIGIEIETEGRNSDIVDKLIGILYPEWSCDDDGSLEHGVEVISPVLKGDHKKSEEDIRKVCELLNIMWTDCYRQVWWSYTYRGSVLNY